MNLNPLLCNKNVRLHERTINVYFLIFFKTYFIYFSDFSVKTQTRIDKQTDTQNLMKEKKKL